MDKIEKELPVYRGMKGFKLSEEESEKNLSNKLKELLGLPKETRQNPLFLALSKGYYPEIVIQLINSGTNLDEVGPDGTNILHYACNHNNNSEVVKLLLEKKPGLDVDTKSGSSLFNIALIEGRSKIAIQLINSGANLDGVGPGGMNGLHYACTIGNSEVARLLLEKKPGLNIATESGLFPLDIAFYKGHSEIVIQLTNSEANLDGVGPDGIKSLDYACELGNSQVVKLLLEKKPDLDIISEDGFLPLYTALSKGHSEIAIQLINSGTNLNGVRPNGMNILHYACEFGNLKVVKLLLEKKLDLDKPTMQFGFYPFNIALNKGHSEVAIQLINSGNITDGLVLPGGINSLHCACASGNLKVAKVLLEKEPGLNIATKSGLLPLDIALEKGYPEFATLFSKLANNTTPQSSPIPLLNLNLNGPKTRR